MDLKNQVVVTTGAGREIGRGEPQLGPLWLAAHTSQGPTGQRFSLMRRNAQ